jgi:hypothetical protein
MGNATSNSLERSRLPHIGAIVLVLVLLLVLVLGFAGIDVKLSK